MSTRIDILNEFYTNIYKEEERLNSKSGMIEYLTTIHFLEQYIKEGDAILEVGAGTGAYSLYFADKGYKVHAVDLVQRNVDVIKEKSSPDMDIKVSQGDAVDLNEIDDNCYDVTLVLGPLYHLYEDEEVSKVIEEAKRVTKKNGILAFAYLTHDSIILDWALREHHLIDGKGSAFDENFKIYPKAEGLFRAFYIDEIKQMMIDHNLFYEKNLATDGISRHILELIDKLDEDEFNAWLKYHLATCEREELQGYSNHMLYIGRK